MSGMAGLAMLGGGGMDMANSALSASWDKRMQKRGIRFSREMALNKYQYAVNDLKAAGLNPILAAGGGISGSGGPAPGGAGAPRPSNYAAAAKEAALLSNVKRKTKHEADRAEYATYTENELGAKFQEEAQYYRGLWLRTKEETEGQKLRNQLMEYDLHSAKAVGEVYKTAPWLKWPDELTKIFSPFSKRRGAGRSK